ncbi:MAG TPA: hypothetical protein VFJ58_00130 [Armatimonadota bacterium]|nr:hypothetical protein [Armatimonadota bacterium]
MWVYTRDVAPAGDRNRTRFNLVNLAACGRIQVIRLKDGEWYVSADIGAAAFSAQSGVPIAGIFGSQVEAEKFREYLFGLLSEAVRSLDLRQWHPEDGLVGLSGQTKSPDRAGTRELAGKETVLRPGQKTLVQRGSPRQGEPNK